MLHGCEVTVEWPGFKSHKQIVQMPIFSQVANLWNERGDIFHQNLNQNYSNMFNWLLVTISAVRKQAHTNLALCHHKTSTGHNELKWRNHLCQSNILVQLGHVICYLFLFYFVHTWLLEQDPWLKFICIPFDCLCNTNIICHWCHWPCCNLFVLLTHPR